MSYVGGQASLFCVPSSPTGDTITNVEWTANAVTLHPEELDFVEIETLGNFASLEFTNLSIEYNNTEIRCEVTFQSGNRVTSNSATLLLLQGEPVKS